MRMYPPTRKASTKRYGWPRTVATVAKRAGLDYRSLSEGEKAVFQSVWRALSEDYDREIGIVQRNRAKLMSTIIKIKDALKGDE